MAYWRDIISATYVSGIKDVHVLSRSLLYLQVARWWHPVVHGASSSFRSSSLDMPPISCLNWWPLHRFTLRIRLNPFVGSDWFMACQQVSWHDSYQNCAKYQLCEVPCDLRTRNLELLWVSLFLVIDILHSFSLQLEYDMIPTNNYILEKQTCEII